MQFVVIQGCGHDRIIVGFTTTCAISAYHHHSCEFESSSGEAYSIQHYVIKFFSDLRQVSGFFQVLRFLPGTPFPVSSNNKNDRNDIYEILLKVALNNIALPPFMQCSLLYYSCFEKLRLDYLPFSIAYFL